MFKKSFVALVIPEDVRLCNNSLSSVAEAFFHNISHVRIPKEILIDQGRIGDIHYEVR